MLAETEKAKGASLPGVGKRGADAEPRYADAPTLADHGITKRQSSDWQKLAAVPEAEFEAALAAPDRPTTSSIIADARKHQPAVLTAAGL